MVRAAQSAVGAVCTAAEMRALEARAVDQPGLMERAGRAVAAEVSARWSARPVAVLCGPGNNGGDGYVVARLLTEWGWPVQVWAAHASGALSGDAARAAARYSGPIAPASGASLNGIALVIDAGFGTGFRARSPASAEVEAVRTVLEAAAARQLSIVAVDVPSGVNSDTGTAGWAVACALTVTFATKKPAHLLLPAAMLCGDVVVADIGVPTVPANDARTWENSPALWQSALPVVGPASHKHQRGRALIVGGAVMTGAARLAARAAARVGAGRVEVVAPAVAWPIYAAAFESIIATPLSPGAQLRTTWGERPPHAALIGPGAGVTPQTKAHALDLLASGIPSVLDADALTVFASEAAPLFAALTANCVLTPHAGEFRALFGAEAAALDKLSAARAAAHLAGAVVVYKGFDTVIAAPDGRAVINSNASVHLATAGSGDVLAGAMCGLIAQGMPAFSAACAAVWLHGAAAAQLGRGLMAEDLPDQLPAHWPLVDA